MKTAIMTFLLLAAAGASAQVTTMPNVFGGENFYNNGAYMGRTSRNVHGGRNFYPAPAMGYGQGYYSSPGLGNQGWYGYHGYGNPELQSGYAIGKGLSQFINAFRGGAR